MKYVALGVTAVLLLLFAFANRQIVIVSFDPFSTSADAALAIAAPLFGVVIAFTMLGVLAGASATWFAQGRYRRAARRHRAEAERLRTESNALRDAQSRGPATAAPGK